MIRNYDKKIAHAMNELGKGESEDYSRFFYLPLVYRKQIVWSLDDLEAQDLDLTDLKREFEVVDRQFAEFKRIHGEEYYDLVYKDFKVLIRRFDPLAYYMDQYDLDLNLEKRADIEIVFEELAAYYDLQERYFERYFEIRDLYTEKVKDWDEQFRKELEKNFEKEGYSPDDLDIAPAHYRWLHLEGTYRSGDGSEPEYEDKDPDELIESSEKLLDRIADEDFKRELEETIRTAKEAKKQGKKVRVYRR